MCEKKNHGKYVINADYKDYYSSYKDPFIIFLKKKKQAKDNVRALKQRKKITPEFSGYHFKKKCREVLKYNYIFIDLLRNIDQNEANEGVEDYPPTYFPPKSDYWTPAPSKDVELYEKPTKRTIDIGFKRRKKIF